MKKILLMISFLFFISAILSAEWVGFGGSEGQAPDIAVVEDRGSSITVALELEGYSLEDALINNTTYTRVLLPHEVTYLKAGFPELPTISRNIAIPDDAQMGYRIVEIEYESRKVHTVLPSKGNLYRNVDPEDVPYSFNAVYGQDGYWPAEVVELSEPFIIRDFRGLSLRFNPFQYNPVTGELRVVKRVVVEVYVIGKGKVNVLLPGERVINREFIGIYDHLFLNSPMSRYPSISEYAGRMVVICADSYMSNMGEFVSWKLQKGIETKIVTISSVGNNQTSIKNFIQTEYNAGGLVWVLLVGDGNQVVPATGTMGSASGADADPVYAYTSGSDYYPDIFVCRFSSRGAATNIDKQVSRSIYYEKTPETGADWYHVGLGVASDQGSPTDKVRCNWLRDSLLAYNYTSVDSSYDPWGTSSTIKSKIEAGTSIIDYIGHGSTTGWSNGGGFGISDINNLNNPWMLPFVLSVACVVGNFNGSDCYCEASVTAGTVAQPDGFVAHWGSSINQSWVPPCYGQEGAVNLLTHDSKNSFGGICFNGASYMIEHYGSTNSQGIEMAQTWHIFGDASLQLRTDTPQSMTVNHPAVIYFGNTNFAVQVVGVQDALCALFRNDTLYGAAYTDGAGNATITIDPPITTSGDVTFTVTAYNKEPYIAAIPAQAASGPYISWLKGIIDDFGGNNNGRINPGESIDLTPWVENLGVDTGYGVYGLFGESDPYVSITGDSAWFGNVTDGDSANGAPDYVFAVSANCPDGHSIVFDFEAHDNNDTIWSSHPAFTVYAPVLNLNNFVVDPGGDQRLDPGETADLGVTIDNDGSEDAASVQGHLFESNPYIDVPDPDANFGTIPAGGSASNSGNPFSVHAASNTPTGETVTFYLEVTSGVYCDTLSFSLTVGAKHYFVWDPDPDHSSGPAIDVALQACGFVGDYNYSLPVTALDEYLAVFVCVGIYSNNFVIDAGSAEATALVNFVNAGGRMYLEGGDVWYWDPPYNNGYDFGPLFGINADDDGTDDLATVQGQGGTFTVGMSFTYNGENNYIDHINPTGSGFLIFRNSSPSYNCGVANDAGSYRTVGTSFEFSGLVDGSPPSTKAALADSIMHFFGIFVGVEEEVVGMSLPKVYGLSQSYPNPCGSHAFIKYQVPRKSSVDLRVYDASGRLVEVVVDGEVAAGYHSTRLDTKSYVSGVYFYRLASGNKVFTKKLIVVK